MPARIADRCRLGPVGEGTTYDDIWALRFCLSHEDDAEALSHARRTLAWRKEHAEMLELAGKATSLIEKKAGCNPDGNSATRGVPCDTHRLARGNTVTRHTTTSREARRRHHTSARRRHFVLVSGTKVNANPMLENLKSRSLRFFSSFFWTISCAQRHSQKVRNQLRGLTTNSEKYTRFTVTWRFRAVSLGKKFWRLFSYN